MPTPAPAAVTTTDTSGFNASQEAAFQAAAKLAPAGSVIESHGVQQGPQVQQTTTALRQAAVTNGQKLDNKIAITAPKPPVQLDPREQNGGLSNTGANTNVNQTNPGTPQLPASGSGAAATGTTDNGDGTLTVNYADGTTARVKASANGDGSQSYSALSPEAGVKYDTDQAISGAKAKAQTQVDQANTTLDQIKQQSDSATQALIQSIQQTYGARITLMEDTNNRTLAAKTQEGMRSGRARYASGLQEGILTDEEQKGIGRVGQLQGEMLSLIQQAQSAQTDKDLALFNDRMNELDKIDTHLQTEVQNLQKNSFDQLKQMQDAQTAAINNAKTQQGMALDRAKAAAPGLADQLSQFTDPAQQAAFLQEYSTQSGIPTDVLMGEIKTAAQANDKSTLDLENIQNEIQNRDAATNISARNSDISARNSDISARNSDISAGNLSVSEQRLALDKDTAAKKDGSADTVNNIVNGVSTFTDLPSTSSADKANQQTIKAKLQALGFYEDTPPAWYIQAQNELQGQDILPTKLKTMWDTYRAKATGGQ